jgi:hypothetical protein
MESTRREPAPGLSLLPAVSFRHSWGGPQYSPSLLTYAYESPDLPTTRVAGSGKPEMVWF